MKWMQILEPGPHETVPVRRALFPCRTIVEQEQEPPLSLIKLNSVAEKEEGWLQVLSTLSFQRMSLLIDSIPFFKSR